MNYFTRPTLFLAIFLKKTSFFHTIALHCPFTLNFFVPCYQTFIILRNG
jgi:hypothetical protein